MLSVEGTICRGWHLKILMKFKIDRTWNCSKLWNQETSWTLYMQVLNSMESQHKRITMVSNFHNCMRRAHKGHFSVPAIQPSYYHVVTNILHVQCHLFTFCCYFKCSMTNCAIACFTILSLKCILIPRTSKNCFLMLFHFTLLWYIESDQLRYFSLWFHRLLLHMDYENISPSRWLLFIEF